MNTSTRQGSPTTTKPRTAPALASPDLADLQRLNIRDVCALIGRSESSVRTLIAAGRFPQADHRDGPRCVRWNAGTVRRWLENTTGRV